jgi:phosphopantothenoylcysteine decarboxylase/phosphopantothenate--cysteine ligase
MSKSKVLFIMTGSIACYKACQVISRLVQLGHEVQVVATPSALQFVGAATLEGLSGKPVVSDLYAAGNVMDHIHLMRWADLILVAPATANFINKAAQGVGDDLATTLFLAHDFQKPFLLAPAMNTSMYNHPVTAKNLELLRSLGLIILDTDAGTLACGESGQGKLLDPDKIQEAVLHHLNSKPISTTAALGRKSNQVPFPPSGEVPFPFRVLVTAGGTLERLDGVRVLGNLSSGATGARLAELLTDAGFEVCLLRAESARAPRFSFGIEERTFTSFASLQSALRELLSSRDFEAVLHAAAVSDFSVESLEINGVRFPVGASDRPSKIHSSDKLSVHFKNNPKLVDEIKSFSRNKELQLVAFKLTSEASATERDLAVEKLQAHAHADLVVHNDTNEIDPSKQLHHFTLYQAGQKKPLDSVQSLAAELTQIFIRRNHDPRT